MHDAARRPTGVTIISYTLIVLGGASLFDAGLALAGLYFLATRAASSFFGGPLLPRGRPSAAVQTPEREPNASVESPANAGRADEGAPTDAYQASLWRREAPAALAALLAFLAIAKLVPVATWHTQWILRPKLEVALEQELDRLRGRLAERLAGAGIRPTRLAVEGPYIVAELVDPAQADQTSALAKDGHDLQGAETGGARLEFGVTPERVKAVQDASMAQLIGVLHRRTQDPAQGSQNSRVTRIGEERIGVEIPVGPIEPARAREMLTTIGFLEFKLVDDQAPMEEVLRAKHPPGVPDDKMIVFEKDRTTQRVLEALLVSKMPAITGDYLEDARVGFDRQQRPIVIFTFNPEAGMTFWALTEKNLGRRLAVTVDNDVITAPVIREPIGAHGQVDARFTSQEAANLALILRSGSLSIPVAIEQERTVGPVRECESILVQLWKGAAERFWTARK